MNKAVIAKAITFQTKLGKTAAGERTRIWIEGARLVDHGFKPGLKFQRTWTADSLTLSVITEAQFDKLAVSERGKVSGKGEKPIIDIVGKLVTDTFGSGSHVTASYSAKKIVITKA